MTFRPRSLIPLLVLSVVLCAVVLAAPSVALAESLWWTTKYTGPDNLPIAGGDYADSIPVAAGFNAISFADAQVGFAVGLRIDDAPSGTRRPLVAVTPDAGAHWPVLLPSIDGTETIELTGVRALSTSSVVVVGSAGFIGRYNGVLVDEEVHARLGDQGVPCGGLR